MACMRPYEEAMRAGVGLEKRAELEHDWQKKRRLWQVHVLLYHEAHSSVRHYDSEAS